MFSGIIDHCGVIQQIDCKQDHFRLFITSQFSDLTLGESIAVDGVCLTVIAIEQSSFWLDVSSETLGLTIIADYQVGQAVNLERALRVSDRMSGHMVTGHVDQTIQVKRCIDRGEFTEIEFIGISSASEQLLVNKGSVAINGVSLTINTVYSGGFAVMCIPHTLQITQLSELKNNSLVNIEYDYVAKLVSRQAALCQQGV